MQGALTGWRGSPETVKFMAGQAELSGELRIPDGAKGIVIFVHGSGSSRFSPRNQYVATRLNQAGLATLLFDLLTEKEEQIDLRTGRLRFDIDFLTDRVVKATSWVMENSKTAALQIGYFGASTGAAAALNAAAILDKDTRAVVSRGGRPDLSQMLPLVKAPTLLIVGENDEVVIELNTRAMRSLQCEKVLAVVPRAGHLFEEPGALEMVADLAGNWFDDHLNLQRTLKAEQ
jgi:putative phosphoribosyl transferase